MKKKYTQIIEIEECKQAVRLARISSRKQERGASLEAQEQIIKEYCEKNELKIIEPYEKAFIFTESSTHGGRKKFHEMIQFIEKQKHKTAIVVHTLDRLQRGFEECSKIKQLLKDDKIEVHFIHETLILNKFSSEEDFTRYDFGILAAKMYLTAMNKNVKRCQKYNREAGLWQCLAKIGYLNVSKTSKSPATLILDPDRAPIIKQIFEEYATDVHSLKSIWLSAREKGLMSKEPNYNPKSKNFGKICPISRNKIHDILTDPFYYGYTYVACEELDEITQKPIRSYYKLIKHVYELEKQKYLEQKQDLQAKAEKFSDISNELKGNIEKAMDFAANLSNVMKIASPDEKNMLLKRILTNCILDGETLKYEIKAPFDKLLFCTNCKKWKDIAMENLEEFEKVTI